MVSQIPGVLGFLCLLPLTLIPTSLAVTSLYEDYGWQADSYATGQHFYSRSAVCVPIPEDLRLCHNVGYRDMRLPNLLEHESMQEVRQQAGAWVPLLAKRCHPDTQLLLCSLFAPVCLDRPIYPCRSLCEAVRDSCVPVMESFGFPWPEMLRCDKFPLDNDLCITAQAAGEKPPESTETKKCPPCDNEQTLESVTEHFCASEFALKMKIKQVKQEGGDRLIMANPRKQKIVKRGSLRRKQFRRLKLHLKNGNGCPCPQLEDTSGNFLIMGRKLNEQFLLTSIHRLEKKKSAELKNIVKKLRRHKCTPFHSTFEG